MADETLEEYIRQLLDSHQTPEVTIAWQGGEPAMMGTHPSGGRRMATSATWDVVWVALSGGRAAQLQGWGHVRYRCEEVEAWLESVKDTPRKRFR